MRRKPEGCFGGTESFFPSCSVRGGSCGMVCVGDGHAVGERRAVGKLGSPAFCMGKAGVPATRWASVAQVRSWLELSCPQRSKGSGWPRKWNESNSVVSNSLWPHRLYSPWNSPGQNTGVDSFPFSKDLPNPGIEPRSPSLQVDSLPTEPQGSPRVLEWVAYPFSRGSSQPRNQTGVSCIAGRFFTSWAIREAPGGQQLYKNGSPHSSVLVYIYTSFT